MNFDTIGQQVQVLDFYNGSGGEANNFGVSFSPSAFAFTSGNYAGNPSSPGILGGLAFPLTITGNVAAGFTGVFSFEYANDGVGPHTLQLFEGLDGTGALLFSQPLPSNGSLPDPAPAFSVWDPIEVNLLGLPGTPHSFVFSGAAGTEQLGLDDITLTPVPEPSTALLLGLGLASLAAAGRRVCPRSKN